MSVVKRTFDKDLLLKRLTAAARKASEYTVLLYQQELKKELSQKGSGRTYRGGRKGQGTLRTRSAPGQPPAVDTGELRRSVMSKPLYSNRKRGGSRVLRFVLLGIKPYGFMLDKGTARIKPRPWIQAPKERVVAQVPRIFNTFMTQALNKFARAK